MMLLYLLASLNDATSGCASYKSIAKALIHLWYSAFVPSSLVTSPKVRVRGLFEDSCTHTVKSVHDDMIRKTLTFSLSGALSMTLPEDKTWLFHGYLEVPAGPTERSAKIIRAAVVMSTERADYGDRWYLEDATPSMRLAE